MAHFIESYPTAHSPQHLWQAINTPLTDPDLAGLVHEGVAVDYEHLGPREQIDGGTRITYTAGKEIAETFAPPLFAKLISQDLSLEGTFFVARMAPYFRTDTLTERHDIILDNSRADATVTRTVEATGEGSLLVVEADLAIRGIGNRFDTELNEALRYIFGESSANTIALLPEILAA